MNACYSSSWKTNVPTGICLFKVNNGNIRTVGEICSKSTIKTPERIYWRGSGVFIVNFEHICYIVLVFPLLAFNNYMPAGKVLSEHKTLWCRSLSKIAFQFYYIWCNSYPVGIYMFKVNNKNSRMTPLTLNISHLVLVFLLLTLGR